MNKRPFRQQMSCFSTVVLAPKSSAKLKPILSAPEALGCSGCLLRGEDTVLSQCSVTDGTLVLKVRTKNDLFLIHQWSGEAMPEEGALGGGTEVALCFSLWLCSIELMVAGPGPFLRVLPHLSHSACCSCLSPAFSRKQTICPVCVCTRFFPVGNIIADLCLMMESRR